MKVKQWWQAKLHHEVWPRPSRWTNGVGKFYVEPTFWHQKMVASQEYFLKITYKQTNWSWKMSMCTLDSLESLKDFYNWTPRLDAFSGFKFSKNKVPWAKDHPKKKVQAESLRHKSKLLVILLLYLHKSHSPSTSKQIFAEFVNGVLGGMVFVGPNTFTFHLSFGGTGCPGE